MEQTAMPTESIQQEGQAAIDIATLIHFISNYAKNNTAHNNTIIQLYLKARTTVNRILYVPARTAYLHLLKKRMIQCLNYKLLPVPYHTDTSLYWHNQPEEAQETNNPTEADEWTI